MTALILLIVLAWVYCAALPLNSPLLPSYDYIVVGGGPAGLTVANRLSEDPTVSVLVLEAGPATPVDEPSLEIPAFIGTDIGGAYDWNLSTVPQIYLDGKRRNIPQGRALGGGTILNGMLWNRGGQGDYNNWVNLGNPGWSWDDLLPYFIRSETYTPEYSDAIAEQFSIQEFPDVHGFDGPVHVGFPKWVWNSSAVVFEALNEIGVPTAYDPNAGLIAGAAFLPMDIGPDEERSTARRAYYDPYVHRPNLWVSTGQTVTQILFDRVAPNQQASQPIPGDTSNGQGGSPGIPTGIFGGMTTLDVTTRDVVHRLLGRLWQRSRRRLLKRQTSHSTATDLVAIGVEYAENAGSSRRMVSATREVIVAAGAFHSPQLLMLSGIGPAASLEALQIPVNIDLPGVGSNLQDHGQVWCWYPFYNSSYSNPTELKHNHTFAAEAWEQYWTNRSGPLTSGPIDGVAFPALPYVMNDSTALAYAAALQPPEQYLVASVDSTVLAGYSIQQRMLSEALQDVTRAGFEIINANDGVLTVASMRPFSRGTVTLSSGRPFDPPIIDPRYGSNPLDIAILQAAIDFNKRLMSTPSLMSMNPTQVSPPPAATEDEILSYIRSRWQTEYHPSGTCAMMPLELGGVVSPELLVYGTRNLRVVDSSIMPMLPAAHLQAVVYGVAEKAADIIKAANVGNTSVFSGIPNSSSLPEASVAPTVGSNDTPSAAVASSQPFTSTTLSGIAVQTTFQTVVYTQTVYA